MNLISLLSRCYCRQWQSHFEKVVPGPVKLDPSATGLYLPSQRQQSVGLPKSLVRVKLNQYPFTTFTRLFHLTIIVYIKFTFNQVYCFVPNIGIIRKPVKSRMTRTNILLFSMRNTVIVNLVGRLPCEEKNDLKNSKIVSPEL